MMRNKTYRSLHPNVRIEIFNRYGMALGSTSVAWVFDTIPPGGAHSENTEISLTSIQPIFRYSSVPAIRLGPTGIPRGC